jgi:hypothetical protein
VDVRLVDAGPSISESDLAAFERRHGVIPDGLDVVIDGTALKWRLHYFASLNDPVESSNLDWLMDVTRATRPKYMVPVAYDEAGNHFYIDARPAHVGTVYFGPTPETAGQTQFVFQAPSFDAFIRSLSPFEQP